MQGYKAKLISTIVDAAQFRDRIVGYKAKLISTIVDSAVKEDVKQGYKAKLISTIVDLYHKLPLRPLAIKPN